MQLRLCYTNYTALQLQLHFTTLQLRLQLQLGYTTLHPAGVRWPLQTLQPLQKTQLQPPFRPSADSLCHPWFTTTSLSYRFPFFETSATALCGTTGIITRDACCTVLPLIYHALHITYSRSRSRCGLRTAQVEPDHLLCAVAFEKKRFCRFSHRHGEATEKPETRDKTRGSIKMSISCETSSSFHPLCSFKIGIFLRVFSWTFKFATSKSMFRARLPPIFITSHKMLRLSRNLRLAATWRNTDNTIRKGHAKRYVWSVAPAMQNGNGHVQSAAPATKAATHLAKTSQKYCACHIKQLSTRYETRLNVTKCHACHTKSSHATLQTSKSDPFAELTIGAAIRPSGERLRRVADG